MACTLHNAECCTARESELGWMMKNSDNAGKLRSVGCRVEVAEKQLRDDLLSMLVAGHETTGSALTWTLHLLAANPATLAKAPAPPAAPPVLIIM